jgi:hypothetical protein
MKSKKKPRAFLKIGLLFSFLVVFLTRGAFGDPSGRTAAHSASGFLPTVLDLLLLLGVGFCFFSSLRVKSFLREGELAYGWVLFSFSFAIFFIAQLLSLCVSSNILSLPLTIIPLARLLSILCLALGIYFMKKILS